MDNIEYIKSLEERIEKLENFIKSMILKDAENINISDCSFTGAGFQKCKNISFENSSIQGLGGAALNIKIDNCTIHNLDTAKSKIEISNCKVQNKE